MKNKLNLRQEFYFFTRKIISFCVKRRSFQFVFTLVLFLPSFSSFSQEVSKITIKREDTFFKAEFDETNYKVIALDKYGNPHENVIKSFVITYQDTKGHFECPVTGNTFPKNTIKYLTKERKKVTNCCLKNIVAQDDEGHIQSLPDKCGVLIYPDCKGCKTKG